MSRYSADSLPETNRAPSFRLPAHASHLLKTVHILPNVRDEPRPWLARLVLLGARGVTAMVVGSGALLARFSERNWAFMVQRSVDDSAKRANEFLNGGIGNLGGDDVQLALHIPNIFC